MAFQEAHGISPSSSTRTLRAVTVLLFLLIGISYLATERAGDYWGDDFALYVHHAKNIASRIPYAHTGYLFNPLTPDYSPAYYPPVFPLALSFVYSFRGLDWHALKIEQSIFLLSAAMAIWLYFRRWLSPWLALLLAAIVAWNPQFYLFHDLLTAEPLFLCLLFLSLERIERAFSEESMGRILRDALILGVLFYLCFGCRSAGLILLPAAWTFAVVRHRRVPLVLMIATALSLAAYIIQKVILGPDLYLAQFNPTLRVALSNLYSYASSSQEHWNPGLALTTTHAITTIIWALAVVGFVSLTRQRTVGTRVIEWFSLFYFALILVWPAVQGFRFLLPLFPLFIFYVLKGASWLVSRLGFEQTTRRWIWMALVLVITVSYGWLYRQRVSTGAIREADGSPAFNELCSYIRENVPPTGRILFSRARLLSLMTDRAAMTYDRTHDFARLWSLVQRQQVRYICLARVLPVDQVDLAPLISLELNKLRPVFNNSDFTLYEILAY